MSSTPSPSSQTVRRRASRAAGPTGSGTTETTIVRIEQPSAEFKPSFSWASKVKRPPRRVANRRLVVLCALAFGFIACAAAGTTVVLLLREKSHIETNQARDQRFVDT